MWREKAEIQRLQEYLRIRSVHPDPDYESCVKFLRQQAAELSLPISIHHFVEDKPVVVMTWEGTDPHLPSILLNSHMDVVPVSEEFWTHPPFEAHITEDGMLYARGVQDMKSLGMLYLEAIRAMKQAGVRMARTVHISFVPDEEIGSQDGMRPFSESQEFKNLNIGFALDESAPHPNPNEFYAFNKERTSRQIKVTCLAEPGHGSTLSDNTAGEKLHYILNKFMELRAVERKKLAESGAAVSGDVTTINLTQLEGGVQINVLPEVLTACFDIRIAPDVDHDAFEEMIKTWCKEAGDGVSFEYLVKNPEVQITSLDNPFWSAIEGTLDNMGKTVRMYTCPGATDARWVRLQGVPAINLTPIANTPTAIHAHNERMHVDEFLKGIEVMDAIIRAVANV